MNQSTDFVLIHDAIILSDFCTTLQNQPCVRGSLKLLAVAPCGNLATLTNESGRPVRQTIKYYGSAHRARQILCSAVKQIGTLEEVILIIGIDEKCGEGEAAVVEQRLKEMMAQDTKTLRDKSWKTEEDLESLSWKMPRISMIWKLGASYRVWDIRYDLEAFLNRRRKASSVHDLKTVSL